MSAKKTDISQISKYLKEELDAHAMHVLEKQAQDDPFLMEAMEGFEQAGTDPQPALSDLNQRLEQRIHPPQKRLLGWRSFAAAASVLLVLGIGGYWLAGHQSDQQQPPLTAQADHEDSKKPSPITAAPVAPSSPRETSSIAAVIQKHPERIRRAVLAPAGTAAAPSATPSDQVTDKNDTRQNSGLTNSALGYYANVSPKPDTAYNFAHKKVNGVQPALQRTLLSKVEGATFDPIAPKGTSAEETALNARNNRQNFSNADPTLVPASAAITYGKSNNVDINAQSNLFKADQKDALAISKLGYQAQQIKASKDSLYLNLQESAKSLREVAIARADKTKPVIEAAHPVDGWSSFEQYLKENAIAIDKHAGTVKLNFIVNSDGTLTDFNITQPLDAASDNQAIALIKSGPIWLPNMDGKPHVVELKIRFHKN